MMRLLITILAIQIGVMLAARPLVWWYFGINRAVRTLENIDASLRTFPTVRNYDNYSARKPPRVA